MGAHTHSHTHVYIQFGCVRACGGSCSAIHCDRGQRHLWQARGAVPRPQHERCAQLFPRNAVLLHCMVPFSFTGSLCARTKDRIVDESTLMVMRHTRVFGAAWHLGQVPSFGWAGKGAEVSGGTLNATHLPAPTCPPVKWMSRTKPYMSQITPCMSQLRTLHATSIRNA